MSVYKGADYDSQNMDWEVTPERHPDLDLSSDLETLRERSQQLLRDNLIVSGMQQTYINQVNCGGPVVYSASKNRVQRDQINSFLKERLNLCDSTGTKSLNAILDEVVGCVFADGDLGINLPVIDGETVVELIEAYRIKTPHGKYALDYRIRNGVQYFANGKIEGLHVLKAENVYKAREEYMFLPIWKEADGFKRKVTTLFKAPVSSRPLASRHVPLSTPMIPFIKKLADYEEAVIIGARVAACFAGFIETENPAGVSLGAKDTDPKNSEQKVMKIKPGTISALKMGQAIKFSAPNRPSDNHDTYVLRSYKTLAMGYRIPYIIAFQDTEQSSYSAFKGAVLDTVKLSKRWRNRLNDLIIWIVNTFILEAMSKGQIRGSLSTVDLRIRWPSNGALDSEKENRGNKLALQNKTKSRQMICDEDGTDFEELENDLLEEELAEVDRQAEVLKRRKEKEKEYGIIFPETAQADRQTAKRPGEQPGTELDEEDAADRRKEDGNWA